MLQTAGIYAVGAWLTVQVGVAVFPVLLLPEWTLRAVVILAILGFPVSVVLAWAYDLTPGGLRRVDRSRDLDEDGSRPPEVPGWTRLALVVLVLGATGAVGWWSWTGWLEPRAEAVASSAASPAAEVRGLDPSRVAVLYFDDLSQGGELGYLAEGLTDAVIHELAQIPALGVVSRNGVKPFRGSGLFLDSIARRLRVGSLVEGSVDRTDDGLVATVQLVNGSTGQELMSRRLRVRGTDPLLLRDTIVAEAARHLGQRLGRELEIRSLRDDTESPRAWEAFLRAKQRLEEVEELHGRLGDGEVARRALREADVLLARAEDADGDWLRPVVMRGEVARRSAKLSLNRMDSDRDLLGEALAHADRALARDGDHPPALALRGRVLSDMSWTGSGAEADTLLERAKEDLRRALELDPDRAEAWVELAQLHRREGDFAGASMAANRAVDADPFLINAEKEILVAQALLWLELEELERARRWLETGRRRYPDELQFLAGELLRLAGGPASILPEAAADTAWSLVGRVEAGAGDGAPWRYGRLQVAAVLAVAGRADSARSLLSRLGPPAPEDAWWRYYEALVRLHLGERDRAVELLEEYLELRPDRREYIANEWWWKPLRQEPGFRRMVATE